MGVSRSYIFMHILSSAANNASIFSAVYTINKEFHISGILGAERVDIM